MTLSPRLLFAESDAFFASVAIRHLRRAGFEVVHVTHGVECLDLLSREPFDVVVTELVLPRLDGYQLIEAIRGNADIEKTPIFILTRLGTREDVERCRVHGVEDYFIKPHHRLDQVAERLFQHWRQRLAQVA